MRFTTLLMETSGEAVEYFRNCNLEIAFNKVEELRRKVIWEKEAVLNIRVAFEELGLPFDEVIDSVSSIMFLFDKLQVRLTQLRDYYEAEKRNGEYRLGRGYVTAVKPVWRI